MVNLSSLSSHPPPKKNPNKQKEKKNKSIICFVFFFFVFRQLWIQQDVHYRHPLHRQRHRQCKHLVPALLPPPLPFPSPLLMSSKNHTNESNPNHYNQYDHHFSMFIDFFFGNFNIHTNLFIIFIVPFSHHLFSL